ncbi:MAG TPA: class I SAM-dependent methyltransferase [Acidobacteriaceae bacterium]|nr:class I SAM-dependent methyltransferase [Acidobacteriaceae bacterium]
MSGVVGKLLWSVRHRGASGTVRAAAHWVRRTITREAVSRPHPFDVEHGTDTGGLIAGGDLASGHTSDRHIEGYAAVPPSRFRGILARWQAGGPAHALADYCFVDLGCGKGRALLLASQLGFREVIGVELNPSLAQIARANVTLWAAAGKARAPMRVEQKDALELEWPVGPCVVFLFNPFDAQLMRQIAESMAAAFRNRPSDLEVLYYKPNHADALPDSFRMAWCETIEIDAQELAADPVAGRDDETRAYQLNG